MVLSTGIEPVTSCVSSRRATAVPREHGGTGEFRDLDLLGFNQTLCQLSYRTVVVPSGFEPDPSVLHAEMPPFTPENHVFVLDDS